ncbi:MAG: hypothetical protein AB8I08_09020 [Sandaracinaceae bacterium]
MHRPLASLLVSLFTVFAVSACGGSQLEVVDGVSGQLVIGSTNANFGVHDLTTGFLPDPATYDVVSGGNLDAAQAAGSGCNGWVTQQPDVVVRFEDMHGFLRFAFRANNPGEDATIIVNDGAGNWHCNDDAVGLNPMVDLADAPPGHYDIWIGSYASGENVQGQLLVTELQNVTP